MVIGSSEAAKASMSKVSTLSCDRDRNLDTLKVSPKLGNVGSFGAKLSLHPYVSSAALSYRSHSL